MAELTSISPFTGGPTTIQLSASFTGTSEPDSRSILLSQNISTISPVPVSVTTPTPSETNSPYLIQTSRFGVPLDTSSDTSTASITTSPASDPSATVTNAAHTKLTFSVGVLVGAVVGCMLGAVLLTAAVFLLCRRKGRNRSGATFLRIGKQPPSVQDDREVVSHSETEILEQGAPKHLSPASSDATIGGSDSTIRDLADKTRDRIATHVESFYTSKSNAVLDTEHEFELEAISLSRVSEPIADVLRRSRHTKDLIKLYTSTYIVSLIRSADDDSSSGAFLPRPFRRQKQPSWTQASPALAHAYSQWRVVTAYLCQNDGSTQTYLAERDAAIRTATRHLCRAFEPWATADEDVRIRDMIGIMEAASELGVLIFSHPASYEWRWNLDASGVVAVAAAEPDNQRKPTSGVILPGLYQITDQDAVPFRIPLCLIEPIVATSE